jgi:aconitate hydratase
MPDRFLVDDSMFVFPEGPDPSVAIYRGPNIGAPPAVSPVPERIAGVVAIVVGDKVTTDDITPAGPYLKYRSNIPRYAQVVFEPLDPGFAARAAQHRDAGLHNVVVAGESYGQGSSREHAAICPAYLGVRAVVAVSIERIAAANLVNFGILPLTFVHADDHVRIVEGDEVEIPEARARLAQGRPLTLIDRTQDIALALRCDLSPRQRRILLAGGILGLSQ